MNVSRQFREQARQLLLEQGRLAERLDRLLEEEQAALEKTDPAPLEDITRRKIDLALALERLEADRRRMLLEAGVDTADAAAFGGWLRRLDPEGDLAGHWDRLNETLTRCRERNRGNGRIIQLQRRHVESALRVLTGRPQAGTYTPQGTSTGDRGGRDLGSA